MQGVYITDPTSIAERSQVAGQACSVLHFDMPCLVDTMDDAVNKTYGAWPDRLYIVDMDGRVALAGSSGPMGFAPSLQDAYRWLSGKFQQ